MSTTLSLLDIGKQTGTHQPHEGATDIGAYCAWFKGWSSAGIVSATTTTHVALTSEQTQAPQTGSCLDKKVYISAKNTTTGEPYKIVVSSPVYDATHFVIETTDQGERITQASGQAFINVWKTKVGLSEASIIFTRGTVQQLP